MMGARFPSRLVDAGWSILILAECECPNAFPMLKTQANKQILMEKRAESIHPAISLFWGFKLPALGERERKSGLLNESRARVIPNSRLSGDAKKKAARADGRSLFPHKEPFLIAFPLLMFVLIHIQQQRWRRDKFLFCPLARLQHISWPLALIILRWHSIVVSFPVQRKYCHCRHSLFAAQQVSWNKALSSPPPRALGLKMNCSSILLFPLSNSLSAPIIWPIGYCVCAISVRAPQWNTWLSPTPTLGQLRGFYLREQAGDRFCRLVRLRSANVITNTQWGWVYTFDNNREARVLHYVNSVGWLNCFCL